jgi:nucleotide-binding universal stress UspA family protein
MQYSKILVPYDASKMSDWALKRAVEIAKTNQSDIFIIDVIPEIPVSSRHIPIFKPPIKGKY